LSASNCSFRARDAVTLSQCERQSSRSADSIRSKSDGFQAFPPVIFSAYTVYQHEAGTLIPAT
jgi:hypothetical protein